MSTHVKMLAKKKDHFQLNLFGITVNLKENKNKTKTKIKKEGQHHRN